MFNPLANRAVGVCIVMIACTLCSVVQAQEYWSVYFYGYLKHAIRHPRVHEGGMDLLGISKESSYGAFQFDNGASTYVDSYGKRSYSIFSDVSHQDFRYGIVTPGVRLTCTYKGTDYDSDWMHTYCFPLPKIRLGLRPGLFADVTLSPKVEGVTNGWLAIEAGYKW